MNHLSFGNSRDDPAKSGGSTWKEPLRQRQKEAGFYAVKAVEAAAVGDREEAKGRVCSCVR